MTFAISFLEEVLDVFERRPDLAERWRRLLGVAQPAKADAAQIEFERVAKFAERIGVSERTGWAMVAKGLPTIGEGRGRRVDVRRAIAWLRDEQNVDDAIEKSARASARRAARRIA